MGQSHNCINVNNQKLTEISSFFTAHAGKIQFCYQRAEKAFSKRTQHLKNCWPHLKCMWIAKSPRAIWVALRNLLAAMACSEEGNSPKNEGKQISNLHFSLQPSCLSTARGQSLQQATIKSRSFCLFNSLSEWFCLTGIYDARTGFNRSSASSYRFSL